MPFCLIDFLPLGIVLTHDFTSVLVSTLHALCSSCTCFQSVDNSVNPPSRFVPAVNREAPRVRQSLCSFLHMFFYTLSNPALNYHSHMHTHTHTRKLAHTHALFNPHPCPLIPFCVICAPECGISINHHTASFFPTSYKYNLYHRTKIIIYKDRP